MKSRKKSSKNMKKIPEMCHVNLDELQAFVLNFWQRANCHSGMTREKQEDGTIDEGGIENG